jgi:trigger factor
VSAAAISDQELHEQRALDALRESARVDVPEAMIEREIERQLADLEYRLSAIGIPLDKYLELSGQSVERLRGERRDAAAQRVRLELALDALAAAEGLEVDESQVQREVQRISDGRKVDAARRRRLQDIARRDLVRQAAGQRLLEIVGGDDFIPT